MGLLVVGYLWGVLWSILTGFFLYCLYKADWPLTLLGIFAAIALVVGFGIGPHGMLSAIVAA